MMHAIIIGCSGAIAMNLTVCKKQVEKQWRQQVVMIIVHKFSYLKLDRDTHCTQCCCYYVLIFFYSPVI